mmetsp:Transcript_56555/g.127598  ORF Transcript_56555/g.127598 Transcript_56555/m.127598 type:complete len:216 (+) Transcript_56555:466-1113(+)
MVFGLMNSFREGHSLYSRSLWCQGIMLSFRPWMMIVGLCTLVMASSFENHSSTSMARGPTRSWKRFLTLRKGVTRTRPATLWFAARCSAGPVPIERPKILICSKGSPNACVTKCSPAWALPMMPSRVATPLQIPYPGYSTAMTWHWNWSRRNWQNQRQRPRSSALLWKNMIRKRADSYGKRRHGTVSPPSSPPWLSPTTGPRGTQISSPGKLSMV